MKVSRWTKWTRKWTNRSRKLFRPKQIQNGHVRIDMRAGAYSKSERNQLYSDQYEIRERHIVEQRLRPDDIVLELGSGVGIVTITCCQIAGSERVHTFEANPKMEAILKRNFDLNGVTPHLQMVMISSRAGTAEFHVSDKVLLSSRYVSAACASQANSECITVPTVSLQRVLAEIQPTFLVVDIEGGELELLDKDVDLSSVERICIEVHPAIIGDEQAGRLIENLIQRGFWLSLHWSEGIVLYFERGSRPANTQRRAA